LALHTGGGVVTPAQQLMSIVPVRSRLEVEAMISNRDIGFVSAGQAAEVKIDTFNFTRYGLLQARSSASPGMPSFATSRTSREALRSPAEHYRIRASPTGRNCFIPPHCPR
jgi:hypothetical protein